MSGIFRFDAGRKVPSLGSAPRGWYSDFDYYREDHGPAAQALVYERHHVVAQVVLQQCDLVHLVGCRLRRRPMVLPVVVEV